MDMPGGTDWPKRRQVQMHEYRPIAERAIGRPIRRREVVHHKDGDRTNNSRANLQVMLYKQHRRVHLGQPYPEATLQPECAIIQAMIDAMPYLAGEDEHKKLNRVGRDLGVSGRTLYNYVNPRHSSRMALGTFRRLCVLAGPSISEQALARLSRATGCHWRSPWGAGE